MEGVGVPAAHKLAARSGCVKSPKYKFEHKGTDKISPRVYHRFWMIRSPLKAAKHKVKGNIHMKVKRLALGFAGTLLLLTVAGAAQNDQTFTGDIMDSQCANLGAHAEMMKDHEKLNTAKECTLACVKNGDKFVLFNAITKVIYQLDDQNKPAQFAGASVTVTGTLDDSKKTIHVADIALAPTPSPVSDQTR